MSLVDFSTAVILFYVSCVAIPVMGMIAYKVVSRD